jgi:hypothetical protein
MPVPDYETLMLPLLCVFGKGITNPRDAIPDLISTLQISETHAQAFLPWGGMS